MQGGLLFCKMMDVNIEKSNIGVLKVKEYLERENYEVKNVSHNKDYKGYDILAIKNRVSIKIEVKCSSRNKGIPDCYSTEFDSDMKFTADYLYIVRLDEDKKPKSIEILSKEDIDKYSLLHKKKKIIKIASKLKTDLKNRAVGEIIEL